MSKPYGNGSGQFDIGTQDMGGWVRVMAGDLSSHPDEVGAKLAHCLSEWFRQKPHLRLVCVVPIDVDGTTVELHGWYEQVSFPDLSPWRVPQ
jgi:hypothetical protein